MPESAQPAKAWKNGVKFGRPAKVTDTKKQEIYSRRLAGAAIGQLAMRH